MEPKTVSNRMYAIMTLFDMHTKYFHQALEGISDDDATERLNTKANHIKWLAGSLIQERYELAKIFGQDLISDADELFKDHKGIQDDAIYPTLDAYKKDWDKISPILREELINATDEKLEKVLEFPGMSFSVYEMVSFDAYREANCIGQIALWRRLLNYPGINYM
ncbi:DinB family protein [Pedobacter frigiditerrae]|uniref:DinB family protein n=1 Tax=Pedobacter frigiditerrae TaxID=2530452 RepID=A0A4R0MYM8_9SPHI|nr:DinB family protein [Pedobacter frigiditerrae]TCC92448.1 DinB family protein [Pedobacter frigiditerrae]